MPFGIGKGQLRDPITGQETKDSVKAGAAADRCLPDLHDDVDAFSIGNGLTVPACGLIFPVLRRRTQDQIVHRVDG